MIRTVARPLLASVFVLDGVQMLKNTSDYTEETADMVKNARRILPPNVAGYIPNDTETAVRVLAGTKIAGAALLGSSKAPRLGAGILTAVQIPTSIHRNAFWSAKDKAAKKDKQRGLITDLALLGGLVITTADTAGKPGLAWRVQKAMPGKSEQEKMIANAQDQATDIFSKAKENAIAGKEAVANYVDDHSDEWKDTAADLRDKAVELGGQAKEFATEQADTLSVQAADLSDRAREQSQELRKQGKKSQKEAQKRAQKEAKKAQKKYRR